MVEKGSYKRSLRVLRKILPFADKDELIYQSIGFAQELVMDLLHNPYRSPVLECDPIGSSNLHQIRRFRRRQRLYYNRHGEGIIFPLDTRLETCLRPWGENHE